LLLSHHGIAYADFHQGKFDEEVKEVVGERPEKPGSLRIRGPFLSETTDMGTTDYLPWPSDLLTVIRESDRRTGYLSPTTSGCANLPEEAAPLDVAVRLDEGKFRWCREDEAIEAEQEDAPFEATAEALSGYLCLREAWPQRAAGLVLSEPHTGIERSAGTYTARSGHLFTVEFLRLRGPAKRGFECEAKAHYSIEIDKGAEQFPDKAMMALGGERRPFLFERAPANVEPAWAGARKEVELHLVRHGFDNQGRLCFRLYLLSPAPFAGGWKPALPGEYELIGGAVGKPIMISGWDVKGKRPRTSRKYAPAGSVYFVRTKASPQSREEAVKQVLDRFWPGSLCETEEDSKMGFGNVLIGGMANV
jgi:hypothetical protein